jgi:hypothetical protein
MKVFIATIVNLDDTEILGVYSTEDVALSKVEKRMEELCDKNEDYGSFPEIIEAVIDDIDSEDYL